MSAAGDKPDDLITYGTRCSWWDSIDKTGSIPRRDCDGDGPMPPLPCCPHCKGVLFQIEAKDWFDGLKRYEAEGHPGSEAMWLWSRGKCFPSADEMGKAYAQHIAAETPPPSKVVALIPCSRIGCPAHASVAFKWHVPPKGFAQDSIEPLTAIMGIKVCQRHFDEDEPNLVERNPEMRSAIEAGCRMMGKVMPDWTRAWVTAIPITSQEYKGFEAMAGKK